jgi:hypothetical protein
MFRPLKIGKEQFGAKIGRHMREFGRDPHNEPERTWLMQYIQQIYTHPLQMREGTFSGQGQQLPWGSHARGPVWFYANERDVVLTDQEDNFITILKDGVRNSTSFQQAALLRSRPEKQK